MNFKDMALSARRQIALYHLRINPLKVKQTTGTLYYKGDRCALGLIAQAFDIPCSYEEKIAKDVGADYDPYMDTGSAINFDYHRIYEMNDSAGMTFAQIADWLEKIWAAEEAEK